MSFRSCERPNGDISLAALVRFSIYEGEKFENTAQRASD